MYIRYEKERIDKGNNRNIFSIMALFHYIYTHLCANMVYMEYI